MVNRKTIAKRLVFHVGGYDPITPHAGAQRRFAREIGRFQLTWSVKAIIDHPSQGFDQTTWRVTTTGTNWQVETDYRLIRWDDVVESFSRRPIYHRIPLGIIAFVDFVLAGALRGYIRTNWQYAVFFLYPFVVFAAFILAGVLAGNLAVAISQSSLLGIISSLLLVAGLFAGPWRWLHLNVLFDDWIFSREYIRSGNLTLEQRLDRLAAEIVAEAKMSDSDELLIIGHSLGAVLAIDLLDRALALDPALASSKMAIALITIGSSVLKIGLHRGATRFRAAVTRVAESAIFWGDYQARVDLMNFHHSDPIAEMELPTKNRPHVRQVEIGEMLEHAMYRRIRRRWYRLHCQFISGNDKRALYDYFMLVCGPVSAKSQILAPDGAISMIGEDGSLLGVSHFSSESSRGAKGNAI